MSLYIIHNVHMHPIFQHGLEKSGSKKNEFFFCGLKPNNHLDKINHYSLMSNGHSNAKGTF